MSNKFAQLSPRIPTASKAVGTVGWLQKMLTVNQAKRRVLQEQVQYAPEGDRRRRMAANREAKAHAVQMDKMYQKFAELGEEVAASVVAEPDAEANNSFFALANIEEAKAFDAHFGAIRDAVATAYMFTDADIAAETNKE